MLTPAAPIVIEACVETLAEALQAMSRGAHQLEVCSDLDADGLTPTPELLELITSEVNIPVKPMIRSRAGHFLYSDEEIGHMAETTSYLCRRFELAGIVFGALTGNEKKGYMPHLEAVHIIADAAAGVPVTFHKAIDLCSDQVAAVRNLTTVPGVKYILSSGGAATALQGVHNLKLMQASAGPAIQIIAAGKITAANLYEIAGLTGLKYFHGRKIV